jgi:hypothetical protein
MVTRLLAVLCCFAIVACAAPRQTSVVREAPPRESGGSPLPADKREQVKQLEAMIDADRLRLELAEPGEAEYLTAPAEPMGTAPAIQNPTCQPAKTEQCTASCTFSDSICKNADSICRLAIEIDDDWARGRCAKANKTCEASRTKCCGCQ